MKRNLCTIAILSFTLIFASCKKESTSTTNPPVVVPEASYDDNDNMLLGNPSGATASVSNPNNYLMRKDGYALSYSRDKGIPNWVSWHLYKNDIGSTDRAIAFVADATLPSDWYHVDDNSYTGSGFDRGHDCPSADRTSSVAANEATFLTTNIIPQAPNLNQGPWAKMESYIRSLLNGSANEAYIIMGNYGTGGVGSKGSDVVKTINNGHVTVPGRIWKVVVLIPNGNNDTTRVNSSTRIISVDMPNSNDINKDVTDWKDYRVSVDAIEKATGYNLLSRLPVTVQDVVEKVIDNQ